MTRVRFRGTVKGEIQEIDLIICLPDEWTELPRERALRVVIRPGRPG